MPAVIPVADFLAEGTDREKPLERFHPFPKLAGLNGRTMNQKGKQCKNRYPNEGIDCGISRFFNLSIDPPDPAVGQEKKALCAKGRWITLSKV